MESIFKIWKNNRNIYLNYFNNYSINQLNKVPRGFNNNLIWNIGHIIVTQQLLIYKGANLQSNISEKLVEFYKLGTKPSGKTTKKEVFELKELLVSLIKLTETDFYTGKFVTYNERITSTGFHLESLKDAFEFNNYHEGLHLGFMMSIKKFV